jgi:DNA-binding transcriptional LysR family regulator
MTYLLKPKLAADARRDKPSPDEHTVVFLMTISRFLAPILDIVVMMESMDYNRAALFVRVVRAGSFTAAAAQVRLPKSSVSRSVQHLEEQLGVRLLQRTTRKLTLTDVGHSFYETVVSAVGALDEAEEGAREHEVEPSGLIRLAGPPDQILAQGLAEFSRRYPRIRVEASLAARHVDLVAEGFDMAVRAGSLADSSLVMRRIGSTKLILVASPGFLRKRGQPKTLPELTRYDFVLYRASGGRSTLKLTGPTGEATVEVRGAINADDLAFCRWAIEAGAGIGLQPIPVVVDAIAEGKLRQVLPEWSLPGSPVNVLLPTTRYVPRRVALLRDYLVEEMPAKMAAMEAICRRAAATPRRKARARPAR